MGERGRYRTKQQIPILDVLKQQKSWFLTVDQLMDLLRQEGVQVGQTTVYRALERLAEDGKVMKLPMEDGSKIRYCYAGDEELRKPGKLVCLGCGRFIPLECSKLDDFMEHICREHGFEPDIRRSVLFGYCEGCRRTDLCKRD